MKGLLPLLLLLLMASALGQAANPQNTFANAEFAAGPSLALNYNDATTAFKDQISQAAFANTITVNDSTTDGAIPAALANPWTLRQVGISSAPMVAGVLTGISLQYSSAPTVGQTVDVIIFNKSGSTFTATRSFVLTVVATAALQTFTNSTGVPAIAITSGQYIGYLTTSGLAPGYGTGTYSSYYLNAQSSVPIGPQTYSTYSGEIALTATIATATTYNSGAATPFQPGFDSSNASNTSAEFAYNAWSAAPNNTLGGIEWNVPWTVMEHIDRLNWNRTGTLVLASKGDIGSTNNTYWELYLQMVGGYSQVCFARNGHGIVIGAWGGQIGTQICTAATYDAMPNGFNYNIVVVNNGAGSSSSLSMYINGLAVGSVLPGSRSSTSSQYNFGAVALTVGGGTGYASSTAFTSTGGGPNCVVAGSMATTSGVPTSGETGITYTADYGCTSIPTIVLTSPVGTGVTITPALSGASMNSTTYPLMVPGYVSGGAYFGIAGTTTTQTPTFVDEFAIFPGSLTLGQISNLFYETKFHEMLLNPVTTPPVLVFDDDGCVDMDNQFALQLSIALHQYGAVNLAGVVAEDPSTTCEALWRQMLDQAGLNQVPLSVPTTFTTATSGTAEPTTNIISYNASTPLSNAAWEPAVTMYRTIFAEHPASPIDIVSGAGMTAIAEFMQSPADSISSLTGLQLMAQNAANGGAIYALGGGCTASAPPATTPCTGEIGGNLSQDYPSGQYVLSHNGALPIYWIGGNPQSAGPGVLSTRTSNDPVFLVTASLGTDVRQCYDCLAVEAAISKYFSGGVQIAYSGGTGYADSTPFTLSGGGPNCQGTGFMTASGGVPNGIEFNWGASAVGSSTGLGNGCTSAPTINLIGATGTGVTLRTYPELVCGTDTVSEAGSTWGDSFTSSTCSNHYVSPGSFNTNQTPTSGALMEWFINSLVDPSPNGQARTY